LGEINKNKRKGEHIPEQEEEQQSHPPTCIDQMKEATGMAPHPHSFLSMNMIKV